MTSDQLAVNDNMELVVNTAELDRDPPSQSTLLLQVRKTESMKKRDRGIQKEKTGDKKRQQETERDRRRQKETEGDRERHQDRQ